MLTIALQDRRVWIFTICFAFICIDLAGIALRSGDALILHR